MTAIAPRVVELEPTSRPPAHTHRATVPALDGIRGIAISFVVFFHLRPDLMPGGWVGMSVFFPLSGFLITRLLLDELARDNAIRLGHFWMRRARRLLPALFVLLAVVALVLVVNGAWTGKDGGATLSSLFYVNNWWQLNGSTDYWAQFAAPSAFEHLWSLSVEEQFYIAWPILVFAAARWSRRPLVAIGTLAAALATAGVAYGVTISWMGWGGMTDQYYNTFVRAAELLAGSTLAVVLAARPMAWTSPRARRTLDVTAGALLAALVAAALLLDGSSERFVADGGMFIAGLATVVLIAAALRGGVVAGLLSGTSLRWMGTRCYSLYLWHWPIIVLVTTPNTGLTGWSLTLLRAGFILAAVVLSFWLVEEPFRRGQPRHRAGR